MTNDSPQRDSLGKTALITGVTGQDGSHLADLLLSKGYEVTGVVRRSSTDTTERVDHLTDNCRFHLVEGDITDVSSMSGIMTSLKPDEMYNLAAQSHVGTSFKQPSATMEITGTAVINMLQILVDNELFHTRFYQASSSEMFGSNYDTNGLNVKYQDEDTALLPNSPYAIAKTAAHHAVRLYRDSYNLHASAGILFNHEGPRRGDNFVTKKITNWITNYKAWLKTYYIKDDKLSYNDETHTIVDKESGMSYPMLGLGNLEAFRDWGYAGDYVEAMWMMLQEDYPDDYVICTGKTATIADFLTLAFEEAGLDDWSKVVYINPEFYRPCEVEYLRGDASKAKACLGWEPSTDLRGLVKLMLRG